MFLKETISFFSLPPTRYLLVATQCDRSDAREVTEQEGKALAKVSIEQTRLNRGTASEPRFLSLITRRRSFLKSNYVVYFS